MATHQQAVLAVSDDGSRSSVGVISAPSQRRGNISSEDLWRGEEALLVR